MIIMSRGLCCGIFELNAQAQTHQPVVQQFSATDGGSGRLEGQGSVSLEGDKPVHVTLNMKQARLLRRDSVTATFNGTVGVIGSVTAPTINGNIIVGPAEIDIAQDFGSGGARELTLLKSMGKRICLIPWRNGEGGTGTARLLCRSEKSGQI